MDEMLAEKVVQPAIDPEHLEYCPTMDLIAVATVDGQIHVYRMNGQRVFGSQNKQSTPKVYRMRWKPNGQCLAVACDNKMLSLTSAHTGKVIHHIDCSLYSNSQVCCLGWGLNFTDTNKVTQQIEKSSGQISLDDIISRNPRLQGSDAALDLPIDLAFLDIEALLPKLSPLSSGGIEDDIFNSRSSLDTMFQPLTTDSTDSADVLIIGFDDGTVHLSIYDSFEIGCFNLHQSLRSFRKCKPLLHSSHALSTTHVLLIEDVMQSRQEMHIVPLDLRLISNGGRYLSLLASKATQLHNVLRYIRQVQGQLYSDFKASQDLPGRFLGNIEETLREHSDSNWIQAAYHLAVTGHCSVEVKEWIVDQLGERGHKRWEKAINTGYESIRRLVHENLLPALERFTVLVSRLRGLAKFETSQVMLGLSTLNLDNILDTVNCLQLVAHRILKTACSEIRQFQAFSEWLRQEIESQAADHNSSDITEKDTNIDYANTLEYIQGPMMHSHLITLFNLRSEEKSSSQWDLASEGRSLFELYKREYTEPVNNEHRAKHLPGLDALVKHLDTQCETVFERIAETQRRNVRFAGPVSVGAGTPACMDLTTLVEVSVLAKHATEAAVDIHKSKGCETKRFLVTYVALGPRANQPGVFEIENGMSSTKTVDQSRIDTGNWTVKDIKFIDDKELVIAAVDQNSAKLFRLAYHQSDDRGLGLKYNQANGADSKELSPDVEDYHEADLDISNPEVDKACAWLEFPQGASWAPEKLVVNSKKGRRVICALAQDRLRYRIFELDSSPSTLNTQYPDIDAVMRQ
ncbi:hypothetical protein ACLMJK_002342 [Lecanora helva]